MSACSPENKLYSELHKKYCGQQVEGRDFNPCSESSAQERHGAVEESPEEDHKNNQRDRIPLL